MAVIGCGGDNRSDSTEFFDATERREPVSFGKSRLYHADCFDWLEEQQDNSIHAVVTDPPYGLHEYMPEQQAKLRSGKGGVWRIPFSTVTRDLLFPDSPP